MKYTCPYIHSGISFEPGYVRPCCSNASAPYFQDVDRTTKQLDIDNIIKVRAELVNQFSNGIIPDCCGGCFQIKEVDDDYKYKENLGQFDTLYINHWRHCNSSCCYCVHYCYTQGKHSPFVRRGAYSDLLPILKDLISKNLIVSNPTVYVAGGECTVLKEFPAVIDEIYKLIENSFLYIYSSGIRYSKTFEKLLNDDRTIIQISLDCGTKEMYNKIKRVNCFDKVLSNIKKYIKKTKYASDHIVLKYILVSGLNDNKDDLEKFLMLTKEIGLKSVQLDIDFRPSALEIAIDYSDLYSFFNTKACELNLNVCTTIMNDALIKSKLYMS